MAKKNNKNNEAFFTRHSIANYGTYNETVASEEPTKAHDPRKQVVPDLPENEKRNGVILAQLQAKELLKEFNPKTDALFFVSSNEARALDTSYYYVKEALAMGFEVIEHTTGVFGSKGNIVFPHEKKSREYVDKSLKKYVRPVDVLSLNIPNTFESMVFNSKRVMGFTKVNWDAISDEDKAKWKKAREIIEADDQGSWGPNFYVHSKEIKKIFPNLEDAEDAYNYQFQRIKKMIDWALNKIKNADYGKNIKLIGFGHENYWGYALHRHFKNHNIGNCETVSISLNNGEIALKRRGKWNSLN